PAPRDLPSFPTRRSSDLQVELVQLLNHARHGGRRHLELFGDVGHASVALLLDQGVDPLKVIFGGRTWHLGAQPPFLLLVQLYHIDRKSTRLNSSHVKISY